MRKTMTLCASAIFAVGTIGVVNAQDATAPVGPEAAPAVGDTAPLQIMTGESIYNAEGEEVGSVDKIIVDTDGSQTAILSVGEFLGLGGKLVSVPASELSARAEGGYSISHKAEHLEAMPEHTAAN